MTEGGDKFAVLCLGTDGDAEAVVAELDARAISDDDAAIDEIVVDAVGIGHLCQEEVGIGMIDLLADGEHGEGIHHAGALLEEDLYPLFDVDGALESLECLLLSEQIDVVGVFHLIKYIDNLLSGESHAETDGSASPCLRHRVEHDEVGILAQFCAQWLL